MQRNRYTVQDAAALVGVGPWTLRRLERLGRIPSPPATAFQAGATTLTPMSSSSARPLTTWPTNAR